MKAIDKTIKALKDNGIEAYVVENGADAKKKVFEIIPKGAEIMTMTSVTLTEIGIIDEIESGNYISAKKEFPNLDEKEKRHLGAAPDWAIGSVHAVTEDGKVLIASNSGSQLPAYSYGAKNVIWVVGEQKIVKDFNEGLDRIYKHSLPLESERAKKAYGVEGSFVSKLLVINKENKEGRIKMIIIKEEVGF